MQGLDPGFISDIKSIYASGSRWLIRLPDILDVLQTRWHLHSLESFPNLSYSYVAKAQSPLGSVVIKVVPPGPRAANEVTYYKYSNSSLPRLIDYDINYGALLLELLDPAFTIKRLVEEGDDLGATASIARVIKDFRGELTEDLPHVRILKKDLLLLSDKIPTRIFVAGVRLFDELLNTDVSCLLHGDLHHDNVLRSGTSWKAIDPHGYIGPRCFDLGAMFRNPQDCFPDGPLDIILGQRVKVLTEELECSREEVLSWAFVYTLIATGWKFQDFGEVPESHLNIVSILLGMLEA